MPFSKLPTEVVLLLGESLEYEEDIYALSLVDRRCYAAINPLLYRRLVNNIRDGLESPALEWAAGGGKTDCVRKLLKAGVPPNSLCRQPLHPFALAAKNGHPDVVRLFLDAGVDPNPTLGWHLKPTIEEWEEDGEAEEDEDEEEEFVDHLFLFGNPLTFAIENGHEEVVYLLIEHGVNLEFAPEVIHIDQPLKIAARKRNLPIVRALLQKGCDPYIQQGPNDLGALDYASARGTDLLQIFISAGVDFKGTESPFLTAAHTGNVAGIRYLIEYGISPDEYEARDLFFTAARLRHWEVAKIFLSMLDVDDLVSRACDDTFGRFFTDVARCGFEDQLKKCLNRGQTLEGSNKSIWTRTLNSALRLAAEQGHCSISKLLLDHGATVEDPVRHESPILSAIKSDQYEVFKLMLDKWTSTDEESLLKLWLTTALSKGRSEIARESFRRLEPWNVTKEWKQKTLLPQGFSGGADALNLLLNSDAFLDPENRSHITEMFDAAGSGKFDILHLFLQAGFDVNAIDPRSGYGGMSLLKTVLTTCRKGAAPEPIAERLLQQGADIEARNQLTDETPLLYMAGRKGSLQSSLIRERAVRFLLQKGATMFFTSNRGQNPLVKAAMKGNFGIVRIFLEYLDEECFSLDDIKPLILEAMKTTHRDCARLLSRWYWRRVYPSSPVQEEGTPLHELEIINLEDSGFLQKRGTRRT